MEIIIKDNFLSEKIFNKLINECPFYAEDLYYKNNGKSKKVHRQFLEKDITPEIGDLFNTFTKHREYNNLQKFIHYAYTPLDFKHDVHYDAEFKIMSAIVYLTPEENYGTTFYLQGEKIEIPWKPNRLMAFCGETNVTWHDYKSNEGRLTYNYFLVDSTKVQNEEYKKNIFI